METPTEKTVAMVKGNEFLWKTLECARELIYGHFRDWQHIRRDGRVPWINDDAQTTYNALSLLLGTDEAPEVTGRVNIGGATIPAEAVHLLDKAFADGRRRNNVDVAD